VNKIFLTLLLLLITACSTHNIDNQKTAPKKELSSLLFLDEAANFLMLVTDDEPGLQSKCNLKAGEAMGLLQPLHAMIDEEIPKYIDSLDESTLLKCADNCHCGLYSDLMSNGSRKQKLLEEAQNTNKKKLVECANKSSKWLCDSNLLKKLKSEVEPNPEGL
jgi:hypothetical protein